MRASDISIKIVVAIEHPARGRRTCGWTPRVTRRQVVAGFEGLPGRIGVFQCETRVGIREVFVFIVFGRPTPTKRQLRRVNVELGRARL